MTEIVFNSIAKRKCAEMSSLVADTKLEPEVIRKALESLKTAGKIRVVSNGRRHIYALNQ